MAYMCVSSTSLYFRREEERGESSGASGDTRFIHISPVPPARELRSCFFREARSSSRDVLSRFDRESGYTLSFSGRAPDRESTVRIFARVSICVFARRSVDNF